MPSCINTFLAECDGLETVHNGNIELVNSGEDLLLDEARVVCNTGYKIDNHIARCLISDVFTELFSKAVCVQTENSTVLCHINGEWEEKTCSLIDCGAPTVENGYGTLIDSSNTTYMAQAVVMCNEGYETNIIHTSCQGDGTWSAGNCAKISCGALPSIPNGVANLSQDGANLYLDTATLDCEFGYTAIPSIFKCTSSKKWEPARCACMSIGNYKGTLSRTVGGFFCQEWIKQSPHAHGYTQGSSYPDGSVSAAVNYCRSLGESYLWCYTTNIAKRWDYCTKPSYIC